MDLHVRPRYFGRLSDLLGINLWVQEEYLLPFPFAGNKWVKLVGQYGGGTPQAAYITNGGISSNHCRTLAIWAAFHGHRCHLILHNDAEEDHPESLRFLERSGASYRVVKSSDIPDALSSAEEMLLNQGYKTVVVPGGGHSSQAIRAYADYASAVLEGTEYDVITHASGTGGTQAGLCIANHEVGSRAKVVGMSIARSTIRGESIVRDAIRETACLETEVDFRDEFVDGGYGCGGPITEQAIALAGSGGLVLDATYTGKAFRGLVQTIESGEIAPGAKVLFWHTGGSYLAANPNH